MSKKIQLSVLEDDVSRRHHFQEVCLKQNWDVSVFDSAELFIQDFQAHDYDLISLDYDLSFGSGGGRGTDVTEFLSLCDPSCPVVIHTSDYLARGVMGEMLLTKGWRVKIVEPRGPASQWIPEYWFNLAQQMIG